MTGPVCRIAPQRAISFAAAGHSGDGEGNVGKVGKRKRTTDLQVQHAACCQASVQYACRQRGIHKIIAVPADVGPLLDDENALADRAGIALGHHAAGYAGAHHDDFRVVLHG